MNLKSLQGYKKLALGRVSVTESYHFLDVYCNSAVQVLTIVRLDRVSVRELNSAAISKSCPGDVGQEETNDTLWCRRRPLARTQRWKSVSDSETK